MVPRLRPMALAERVTGMCNVVLGAGLILRDSAWHIRIDRLDQRSAAIHKPPSGLAMPVGCGPDLHSTPKPCDDGEQDSRHSGQQQRNPKRHVPVGAKVANVHAPAVFQDEDQQQQQDDGEERQENPRPADPGRFCRLLGWRLLWCLGSRRMLLPATAARGRRSHEHSRPFLPHANAEGFNAEGLLIAGISRGGERPRSVLTSGCEPGSLRLDVWRPSAMPPGTAGADDQRRQSQRGLPRCLMRAAVAGCVT